MEAIDSAWKTLTYERCAAAFDVCCRCRGTKSVYIQVREEREGKRDGT
jgi:hypothetical protein